MKKIFTVWAVLIVSNSLLGMERAPKQKKRVGKSTTNTRPLPIPSTEFFNLPPDVKREIQRWVFIDITHNRESLDLQPKEDTNIVYKPTERFYSNVFNKLDFENLTYYRSSSPTCFFLSRYFYWTPEGNQVALRKVVKSYFYDETLVSLATPLQNPADTQADGPNNTNDVLIAGTNQTYATNTIYYGLKQIPPVHDKTVKQMFWHIIAKQRLITMALSPTGSYAILGLDLHQKQILSWYRYNKERAPQLLTRTLLPGQLSQIAFITPNILAGLTTNKKFLTMWVDQQHQLKYKIHKFPFEIEKFALDSQNTDFLAFFFKATEKVEATESMGPMHPPCMITMDRPYGTVAVLSLKNRNSQGKCIFKVRKLDISLSNRIDLAFINGVVIASDGCKAINWKVPAALFSTFLAKKN